VQENTAFSLRKRKMYLSIERIAFSTLWKFFNDIFKAFHGYLHRQRIISCISLAILFKKGKKKGGGKGKKEKIKHHQKNQNRLIRPLPTFLRDACIVTITSYRR